MRNSRTYPLLSASGRAVVDWVETRRSQSSPGEETVESGDDQEVGQ
jgi:hypothetical protein